MLHAAECALQSGEKTEEKNSLRFIEVEIDFRQKIVKVEPDWSEVRKTPLAGQRVNECLLEPLRKIINVGVSSSVGNN